MGAVATRDRHVLRPGRRAGDVPDVRFEVMHAGHLDAVLAVEQASYGRPWTRGNFMDGLAAGYQAVCLLAGEQLLGYYLAMAGVQEVHLLNLAVAPDFRRQGWARVLLDALALWARGRRAESLWLEVRADNAAALALYERQGFRRVGLRKGYYPAGRGRRVDAVLMSLPLVEAA